MTLSEMFPTAEEFVAYAESTSGIDYIDEEVMTWFNENPDYKLSYTGVQRVLNTMKVPTEPEE